MCQLAIIIKKPHKPSLFSLAGANRRKTERKARGREIECVRERQRHRERRNTHIHANIKLQLQPTHASNSKKK